MKLNIKKIEDIAEKSKFNLTKEESEHFTDCLNETLAYFEKVREVNTDNVEPTVYMKTAINTFRKDEVKQSSEREEILNGALETKEGFYCVPSVFDKQQV